MTFFTAFGFHLFIVYPLLFYIFVKRNPYAYMKHFIPAKLTAIGTSSSAATMPVTIECCHKAGIIPDVYSFLIPLGISLNMDGYALGLPIGVCFIAAGLGRTLSSVDIIVLLFT